MGRNRNGDAGMIRCKSIKLLKIKKWLEEYQIHDYTINEDLTVDVNGNVEVMHYGLVDIPVQFGTITGTFNISCNFIYKLSKFPRIVKGDFACYRNRNKITKEEIKSKTRVYGIIYNT